MTEQALPVLQWRLRERMHQSCIASIAELHRRLGANRVLISEVQLGRLVRALPVRLNTPLLQALCRTLECAPGDLLCWDAAAAPPVAPTKARKRARNVPSPEEIQKLVGPRFHLHGRSTPDE